MTKKTIHLYRLTDARGNQETIVVNEPGDNGRIGGFDAAGQYRQFDTCEMWHSHEWAAQHGMKMESAEMEIDIPEGIFK